MPASTHSQDSPAAPTVVKTYRVFPPKHKTATVRFRPDARASKARIRQIATAEALRVGVAPYRLIGRARCESELRWWVVNSLGCTGTLQFMPSTFRRGMSGLDTRKVVVIHTRTVRRPTRIVDVYSDGTRRGRFGYPVRVKRTRRFVGWIPRHPPVTHVWAQLRIGALSIAGRGTVRSSEWVCPA